MQIIEPAQQAKQFTQLSFWVRLRLMPTRKS